MSGAPTESVNDADADEGLGAESVTVAVMLNTPAVVGVPTIRPIEGMRRSPAGRFSMLQLYGEPRWPKLPTKSVFVPYFLSRQDVLKLVALCAGLNRPPFRAALYRALLLVLYCTGIRFGEALRLRIRDVNTRTAILYVDVFKGRARWVPFHRSLACELDRYLAARVKFASAEPDARFFVDVNRTTLPVNTASGTLRGLFQLAGMKPAKGRIGPRPYDFRHAFAVHRLSQWYRQGVDLHTRLPWLSTYTGWVVIGRTRDQPRPEIGKEVEHRSLRLALLWELASRHLGFYHLVTQRYELSSPFPGLRPTAPVPCCFDASPSRHHSEPGTRSVRRL